MVVRSVREDRRVVVEEFVRVEDALGTTRNGQIAARACPDKEKTSGSSTVTGGGSPSTGTSGSGGTYRKRLLSWPARSPLAPMVPNKLTVSLTCRCVSPDNEKMLLTP